MGYSNSIYTVYWGQQADHWGGSLTPLPTAMSLTVIYYSKLAARYVSNNAFTLHRMMGLSWTVRLVFGWYDNFDLLVSAPKGHHDTLTRSTEFQVQRAGIIEVCSAQPGIMILIIPCLTTKQLKSVGNNIALPLILCTGP